MLVRKSNPISHMRKQKICHVLFHEVFALCALAGAFTSWHSRLHRGLLISRLLVRSSWWVTIRRLLHRRLLITLLVPLLVPLLIPLLRRLLIALLVATRRGTFER